VRLPTVLNEKSNYRPDYPLEIPSFGDEDLKNYLPETLACQASQRRTQGLYFVTQQSVDIHC
jgi:hypothetical protein